MVYFKKIIFLIYTILFIFPALSLDESLIAESFKNWTSSKQIEAYPSAQETQNHDSPLLIKWRGFHQTTDVHKWFLFNKLNFYPHLNSDIKAGQGIFYILPANALALIDNENYLNFYCSQALVDNAFHILSYSLRQMKEDSPFYCSIDHILTMEKARNKGLAKLAIGQICSFIFEKTNCEIISASVDAKHRPFSKKAFIAKRFNEFPYDETEHHYKYVYEINGIQKTIVFYTCEGGNLYLTRQQYYAH